MTTQPEALRLADALEAKAKWVPYGTDGVMHAAAAELRRLSAENERLAAEVANRNRRALDGDMAVVALENTHAYYEKLEAQRDALLEALRWIDKRCPVALMDMPFHIHREMAHDAGACARAAIKQAEGNNP